MKQQGFFDEDNRLSRLSKLGDPLKKVSQAVDWEIFRPLLNAVFHNPKKESDRAASDQRKRVSEPSTDRGN